ncbi:MAG: tetraacyldisaccharide 4'-kinase [Candidatus Omnitrophota bacterium]|jgi:tetraacyldisaccharide 4'-kinase
MKEYLYNLATDKSRGFLAVILKFILLLLSFIYGLIIRTLIFISSLDLKRFDIRVISIGNITVGGTGKTSLVEFISSHLKKRGHRLAVLTRGYKRKGADSMGDEPRMLSKNLGDLPVIVDKNRERGAKRAIREYNSDTVILDDGMQQWHIRKDLEIVTIDALNPFGNRHMLPRGILRQPLSYLKKADIFVLTKTNLINNPDKLVSVLNKYNPKALVVESIHNPVGFYEMKNPQELFNVDYLKGKEVALLSGIGDPDSFSKLILNLGIRVGLDLRFSDHHNYTLGELEVISGKVKESGIKIVVTTEKDAARFLDESLCIFEDLQLLVLRIELRIVKNEELFFSRLFRLYSF